LPKIEKIAKKIANERIPTSGAENMDHSRIVFKWVVAHRKIKGFFSQ